MSFYQQLNHYYDLLFPANPAQIKFIENHCAAGSRILDIAAGTGNQALLLAKKGFEVTATDNEQEMVEKMKEKAENDHVALNVIRLSMEKIELLDTTTFDMIICIGNSIVHLQSLEHIRQMITNLYKMLENDGTLIIQTVNYDRIIAEHITKLPIIKKPEGITFARTYDFQNDKILFTGALTVEMDGETQFFENAVELYPLQSYEMVSVLQEAGFSEIALYGDFQGQEYSIASPAMIVMAKK